MRTVRCTTHEQPALDMNAYSLWTRVHWTLLTTLRHCVTPFRSIDHPIQKSKKDSRVLLSVTVELRESALTRAKLRLEDAHFADEDLLI